MRVAVFSSVRSAEDWGEEIYEVIGGFFVPRDGGARREILSYYRHDGDYGGVDMDEV